MRDRDFIRETMRMIGVKSISTTQEAAIMAAPSVAEPAYSDWEQALRRRAIVVETVKALGFDPADFPGLYSTVWIACRNLQEGRVSAAA